VQSTGDGYVTDMGPWRSDEFMINGGFFALRREIFDYLQEGEELVEQPFQRLREKKLLATFRYKGFWQAMDTFKDKIAFDRMEAKGDCPWMVWKNRTGG
jgi:glucose-1-phosphate cytidylyltransferase